MENNNEQQEKQQQVPKQHLPLNLLEQIESDHAMAAALQQQESAFTMLETIESEAEDEENEEEDEEEEIGSSSWTSSHDYDANNFESQEFEAELEFMEEEDDDDGEGGYTDDEIEEDDIDPDEMTYEELIALGEIVGEENRGLSIEQITASLSPYVHKFVQCSKTIVDRCVICQIEYQEAEQLVALQCQHPFHTECINQWLQIKKVCPICSVEVKPTSNPEKI